MPPMLRMVESYVSVPGDICVCELRLEVVIRNCRKSLDTPSEPLSTRSRSLEVRVSFVILHQ
jgi:hypothetical protein